MFNFFSISKHSLRSSLIVGSALFLVMLDASIIVTSMPRMAQDFAVSPLEVSLGVSIYLLTAAVFVPPAGWLADRFGAVRVFLFAIVVFCVASLACGVSTSFYQFVLARAIQGFGGALMLPVGRMIVLNFSEKSELTRAMTILTWPALSAPVLGPVVGGFITTYFDWRWNFYINLPIGCVVFFFALKTIPRMPVAAKRPFDLLGFVLCAGALTGSLGGLESFSYHWLSSHESAVLLLLGLFLVVVTVLHLNRCAFPLLNLRAVSIKTFSVATVTAGTWFRVGLNAPAFLLPLYLQLGLGFSPFAAGAYVMVYFVGNLAMKTVSPLLISVVGFRRLLFFNGCLCGLTMCFFVWVNPAYSPFLTILLLLFSGACRSLQFGALNALTFADVGKGLRSSAAPLSALSMQVSAGLSVALIVLILHCSKRLGGRELPSVFDFNVGFWVLGVFTILLAFLFLRLSSTDGAEVSGYTAQKADIAR